MTRFCAKTSPSSQCPRSGPSVSYASPRSPAMLQTRIHSMLDLPEDATDAVIGQVFQQPQRPTPAPSCGACPAPAKAALHRAPPGFEALRRAAAARWGRGNRRGRAWPSAEAYGQGDGAKKGVWISYTSISLCLDWIMCQVPTTAQRDKRNGIELPGSPRNWSHIFRGASKELAMRTSPVPTPFNWSMRESEDG